MISALPEVTDYPVSSLLVPSNCYALYVLKTI